MPLSQINTPEKDIMLSLIKGYISNLQKDLTTAQQYLSEKDWIKLKNLAHSIQGAAGGFGFVKIGEMILQLELDIIEEKYENVPIRLTKAQKDLTFFTNIPNVDLSLGLCNFDQNLEKWHEQLLEFTSNYSERLNLLKSELSVHNDLNTHTFKNNNLENNIVENNILENNIDRFSAFKNFNRTVKSLGMKEANLICQQIISSIRKHSDQVSICEYINRLQIQFQEIQIYCNCNDIATIRQ